MDLDFIKSTILFWIFKFISTITYLGEKKNPTCVSESLIKKIVLRIKEKIILSFQVVLVKSIKIPS